jgi:hypothetical protein
LGGTVAEDVEQQGDDPGHALGLRHLGGRLGVGDIVVELQEGVGVEHRLVALLVTEAGAHRAQRRLVEATVESGQDHALAVGVEVGHRPAHVDRELAEADEVLGLADQLEERQVALHPVDTEAELVSQFGRRAAELLHPAGVGAGLVDGVQVDAVHVLDQHGRRGCHVVALLHFGGDHRPAEHLGHGPKTALAGDNLVAVVDGPQDDLLDQSVLGDRRGQGAQLLAAEHRPVVGTRVDQ